jgi:ADP-ribose pyrophosphatase
MSKEIIHDGKYLRLVKQSNYEFIQRKNITGIVGILAITNDNKLVLVEQFRVPVGKRVIEIPAGLAGDSPDSTNEDLSIAAARELEEETGYRASTMTRLAAGVSSAGLCDEIITLFRAEQITKVSKGGGADPTEDIHVHEIPLDEVESWLTEQTTAGKLIDLKVYSALHFAR